MDSLTQIVLGASVGEAVLGHRVGNKAILWGAIGGTIPDLDTVARFFLDTVDELHVHRGFSHSIFFCILFAPVMGWAINKIHYKLNVGWKGWTAMAFMSLFTHPLLDCFTTWGTQLFWPFDLRVAFKTIFVIDPLYTIPFLLLLLAAMRLKRDDRMRRKLNHAALTISSLYLMITVVNKYIVTQVFEERLNYAHISHLDVQTRPAPLNNILWAANVETEEGFYITYYSFLDSSKEAPLVYYPKNHKLLLPWQNDSKLQKLLQITEGFYTVEQLDDESFLINDLRFGKSGGLTNESSQFVFAYLFVPPSNGQPTKITKVENKMDQAGKMLGELWTRIKGI